MALKPQKWVSKSNLLALQDIQFHHLPILGQKSPNSLNLLAMASNQIRNGLQPNSLLHWIDPINILLTAVVFYTFMAGYPIPSYHTLAAPDDHQRGFVTSTSSDNHVFHPIVT